MQAPLPTQPASVGDYTLGALLGRGGMSEVYAASHPTLGDRLALKLLRDDADGAFHVEAHTRDVHHRNVARVRDAGLDPVTNRYFLVMDRIDGGELAARLSHGPLDEPTARTLFAALADGMHAVHAHGLVHRDLKPANVMLHEGEPRIVDFGIAKLLGDNAALVTSRRIGTLGYMAPEQLVGGMIAPSVDVWALGIMLFEAVTGRLPFGAFTENYSPQLVETAPRVRSIVPVSPAYDALVAQCLEGDPTKRPPMAFIARALRGEVAVVDDAAAERITQDVGALPPARTEPRPARTDARSVAPDSGRSSNDRAASDARRSLDARQPADAEPDVRLAPRHDARRRIAILATTVVIAAAVVIVLATRGTSKSADATASNTSASNTTASNTNTSNTNTSNTNPSNTNPSNTNPSNTNASNTPPNLPNTASNGPNTSNPTESNSTASSSTASTPSKSTASTPSKSTASTPSKSTASTASNPSNSTASNPSNSTASTASSASTASTPSNTNPSNTNPSNSNRSNTSLVVEVRSKPAGAQILVGGTLRGSTPARIELAGPTAIVVKRTGYRSARVQARKTGAIDVNLVKLPTTRRETLD